MREYVVLDIETTGLSKSYHKITEIAAVKIKDGEIIDKFQKLVNPEVNIPRFITKLTGISNELVKNEKTIKEIMPEFSEFISDLPIIAHNASFDYGFLNYNSEQHLGFPLNNIKLCTRKLASRLLPDFGSKKLSNLCEHYNIVNDQAHRALTDTLVTHEIFNKFLEQLNSINIKNKDEIIKFENTKISKCHEML